MRSCGSCAHFHVMLVYRWGQIELEAGCGGGGAENQKKHSELWTEDLFGRGRSAPSLLNQIVDSPSYRMEGLSLLAISHVTRVVLCCCHTLRLVICCRTWLPVLPREDP